MTKRVLLHIGTHKTGTSALQKAFENQRSTLAAAGIWYPSTNREPYPHLPKHSSLHAALREPGKFVEEISLMSKEADDAGCETMLISAEGFSEPPFERLKVFEAMRNDFEINVYVYLRRQDQYLESLWNQYVKQGRETRPVEAFCKAPHIRQRGDYIELLDFWAQVGTVHPSEYGAAKRLGILEHFTTTASLPMLTEADYNNPSLGMNDALLRSWFNGTNEKPSKRLQDAMKGDLRRIALGSTLRKEILESYATCNAALAKQYGITFASDMPEEEAAPLTSPDPEFVVSLLAFLSKGPAAGVGVRGPEADMVKPEDLRIAANHLRRSRPDVALRLVRAGLAMKPGSVPLQELAANLKKEPAPPRIGPKPARADGES